MEGILLPGSLQPSVNQDSCHDQGSHKDYDLEAARRQRLSLAHVANDFSSGQDRTQRRNDSGKDVSLWCWMLESGLYCLKFLNCDSRGLDAETPRPIRGPVLRP